MAISSIGTTGYYDLNGLLPSSASGSSTASPASGLTSSLGIAGNTSSLSSAVLQALSQVNGGSGIDALLGTGTQQAGSDFMNSLFAALPGFSSSDSTDSSGSSSSDALSTLLGGGNGGQSVAPVQIDQSSPTAALQGSIQNLINQLNDNSGVASMLGDSSASSGPPSSLQNLQQSFNSLITSSGGNPSQTSLQSFLQTVAANIQGSVSVGALFDTSA